MFKKAMVPVLLVVVSLVGMFLFVVAMKPNEFLVRRSATMAAPPEAVFAQVNDFHNWEAWSPWAKLDPKAKNTFSGPASGKDAKFAWAGNNQVGEGDMTITESKSPEHVKLKLHFIKPMEDTCDTEFMFEPVGSETLVTWTMNGKHQNYMGKLFCTLMNMEEMIGGSFDEGLASIKSIVEGKTADGPSAGTVK